ncbi:ABC transporter permease [Priestia megaterium]|uniref:ABC transporter permease n=1 Tax=Priestia megaterium TaxID=1404 RepID=UPI00189F766A|nr:ABC transporter permease [Priestia megaterium]
MPLMYKIEWMKLKRQRLWIIMLFVPLVGCSLGAFNFSSSYDLLMKTGTNQWYQLWTQVTFFYALFLFPILSGIYASFICRVDHLDGGWKQLLALPVSRKKVYIAKLGILMTMILITQIILVLIYLSIGNLIGLSDSLPLSFIVLAMFNGWLASLPLASIQLWLSLRTKSFGIPLGLNIFFSFSSLAAMILKINFIYPWAQPSLAMAAPTEKGITSYPLFFCVVFITFLITFLLGCKNFTNRDIYS